MTLNGKQFYNKKAIIWDWNGTLLNDIEVCIDSMNVVLQKRQLPVLYRLRYQNIFTFPVKDYYRELGFDFSKEDFELPAMEFIDQYYQKLDAAALFGDVVPVLEHFSKKGFHQSVLSAMEHDSLIKSLKDQGIFDFFDVVSGIDDHYAHSKLENGFDLVKQMGYNSKEIVLVGDTLHDFDVANELKIDCLLVSRGHQSKGRLEKKSKMVLENLKEIINLLQ